MDNGAEVRGFLTSRRERLTPDVAGITLYGGRRRVKGLRREEVAMLAGVSTDYYTRLERGNLAGVSEAVLEALARALQLDEAERAHLFDLAAAANASARRSSSAQNRAISRQRGVRPGVQRILDSLTVPAYARNTRGDVLAANQLARALFSEAYGQEAAGFNMARYLFLDQRSRSFYVDWEVVARDMVAALRIEAGRNPRDRGLSDLVGELSTRSQEFATLWSAHNVKIHATATKTMRHSVVGELELTGEALALPGDPGLILIIYTVDPNSASADALGFLASWSAHQAGPANEEHQPQQDPAGRTGPDS